MGLTDSGSPPEPTPYPQQLVWGAGSSPGQGWSSQVEARKHPVKALPLLPMLQVVMKVVQLLPDGHRMKKEVDMALDTVSETMTPMHYHLREIIICTYRQVSVSLFHIGTWLPVSVAPDPRGHGTSSAEVDSFFG